MPCKLFPRSVPVYKRLFDLLLTIPGLIIISPILGIIALLIWLIEGRPVIFSQPRPGLHGEIFTVYKFRTMRIQVDKQGNPLPDKQRLSPLGIFLRSFSLDELPELFNVLRGEMSLVGPRPLLVAYLDRYTGTGPPPRGAARDDRLGAGQRAQRHYLGGEIPPGCVVRGPLLLVAGYLDTDPHIVESALAPGNQPAWRCDSRRVHGGQ